MTVEELPPIYRYDDTFNPQDVDEEILQSGRGHRRRKEVSYNDGLSDEAWTAAVDAGEDPSEIAAARRARRGGADFGEEDSSIGSPAPERRKKKGRPRKEEYEGTPVNGKRKRAGGKSMSVTPSFLEEDEDAREAKRRKVKDDVTPAQRTKMKEIFQACMQAVLECTDVDGRKRCDMFKELPSKKEYPDYYQTIVIPIAISTIRKRAASNYYKSLDHYLSDWRLMFNNARTYNQEGSWVYVDADEMQKVLENTFNAKSRGSGLVGAEADNEPEGSGMYGGAASPQDDDDLPRPPRKGARKRVQSEDGSDYSGSDEE